MRFRKLRIAWSVAWGIALLCCCCVVDAELLAHAIFIYRPSH